MENKKRHLSIRVNGKERVFKDEEKDTQKEGSFVDRKSSDLIPKPDNLLDFGSHREEKIRNEEPYWDDGNREKGPKLPFKRKKKKFNGDKRNFSLKHYSLVGVLAVVAATVVGVSFGLMLLSVFTSDKSVALTNENGSESQAVVKEMDRLPSLSVEIVQGGAFSTIEKGEEMVEHLRGQNMPAALLERGETIYMFIGLAQDRAQALALSEHFATLSQDTYVKPYAVPSLEVESWSEEGFEWFYQLESVFMNALSMTNAGLSGGVALQKDEIAKVRERVAALHEGGPLAFEGLSEERVQAVNEINEELTVMSSQLASFEENDPSALWQVQQSLLNVLLKYNQFIDSFS